MRPNSFNEILPDAQIWTLKFLDNNIAQAAVDIGNCVKNIPWLMLPLDTPRDSMIMTIVKNNKLKIRLQKDLNTSLYDVDMHKGT